MQIGIRAHDFPAQSFENLANTIKENHLCGAQLALNKAILWEDDIPKLDENSATAIKEYFTNGGVKVSVLSCYINPSIPDETIRRSAIERFMAHIEFAKLAGLDVVGTETGSFLENCDYHSWNETEEAYQICLSSFTELAKVAEKNKVSIGIEPVVRHVLNSSQMLKRLIDDIGSEYIKVIFDPVNLLTPQNYTNQQAIIDEAIELFGDRIVAVHLKDFVLQNGEMIPVALGLGELDLRYLLKKLPPNRDFVLDEVDVTQLDAILKRLGDCNE